MTSRNKSYESDCAKSKAEAVNNLQKQLDYVKSTNQTNYNASMDAESDALANRIYDKMGGNRAGQATFKPDAR